MPKGRDTYKGMIGYHIHYIIPFCSILQIYFLPQKEVNYHLSLSLFLSSIYCKKREKQAQTI